MLVVLLHGCLGMVVCCY